MVLSTRSNCDIITYQIGDRELVDAKVAPPA